MIKVIQRENQIINCNKLSSKKKVFILTMLLLTNLVDGSHAESVTVSVLQWLDLHLKMICQDEGGVDDDEDAEDDDEDDDEREDED